MADARHCQGTADSDTVLLGKGPPPSGRSDTAASKPNAFIEKWDNDFEMGFETPPTLNSSFVESVHGSSQKRPFSRKRRFLDEFLQCRGAQNSRVERGH